MCGDIGFPDKLFQCMRCLSRFQHNYCTNYYYEETSPEPSRKCDWCRSEDQTTGKHKLHSKKDSTREGTSGCARSDYNSGERIKQDSDREKVAGKGRNIPSSKTSGRRYKLLKDVLS